jgi:hypothetical protein
MPAPDVQVGVCADGQTAALPETVHRLAPPPSAEETQVKEEADYTTNRNDSHSSIPPFVTEAATIPNAAK